MCMKIWVIANDTSWNELTSGNIQVEWIRGNNIISFVNMDDLDAVFDLSDHISETDYSVINKPVFINSVSESLHKINASKNVVRINGWKGFLNKDTWEVAGTLTVEHRKILSAINKNVIIVPDEPGFISARIISMIINEAYYAKGENVSTEKEIDIALKLGTNYPFGPFEWAKIIGIKNIYGLLKILSETDMRYNPSAELELEATI